MKKSKHPFDKYFRRHGHYPQLKIRSGVQRLTVEFCPGYVRIKTSSPFSGEVYITRSAFLQVLRRSVPIARRWSKHPDFDVPQRVYEASLQELAFAQELRQQKKARRIVTPDPARQRRRYLKAKERAQRRAAEKH